MPIKAVIFDIGGVVVHSPLVAIRRYEADRDLPPDYLNCLIQARGADGAFQRFERGELALRAFYAAFSADLSDARAGNAAYAALYRRRGEPCPALPDALAVDGRELFGRMMRESTQFDDKVVDAIARIRASRRFRTIALTNNFSRADLNPRDEHDRAELAFLGWDHGAVPPLLRAMFDDFCDSSTVGLRKPDPAFFLFACERNAIRPDEAVFLDDIGPNLAAAKKLGMRTIQVKSDPDGSRRALAELEEVLGLDLTDGGYGARPRL